MLGAPARLRKECRRIETYGTTRRREGDGGAEGRRRGRRPEDAVARRVRVIQALADLESARVPFSMMDVAERAGISRATLYRDAGLRDLIGTRGDSPVARPVDHRVHNHLKNQAETLATDMRTLRRALRAAEKRLREAEERADGAETRAVEAERARRTERLTGAAAERIKTESYAEGFAAGARARAAVVRTRRPTRTCWLPQPACRARLLSPRAARWPARFIPIFLPKTLLHPCSPRNC